MPHLEGIVQAEDALVTNTAVEHGMVDSIVEPETLQGTLQPSEWTRDNDFGPPPRKLSRSLRLHLLFMNECAIAGCALIVIPCMFGTFMFDGVESGARLTLLASTSIALANATDIVRTETNMQSDNHKVYQYSYSFQTQDGQSIQGKCYATGVPAFLSNVVTYSTVTPTASVLEGMRPTMWDLAVCAFYLGFQLPGWIAFLGALAIGSWQARCLGSGIAAKAVLAKHETSVVHSEAKRGAPKTSYLRHNLTFEVKSPHGTTVHEVQKSRQGPLDSSYTDVTSGCEQVLYDPAEPNPDRVLFLNQIPEDGRVAKDGSLEYAHVPGRPVKFAMVLLPVLAAIAATDLLVVVASVSYVIFYLRGVNIPLDPPQSIVH